MPNDFSEWGGKVFMKNLKQLYGEEFMQKNIKPVKQRTLDDHFIDWVSENIRFGYGSGEPYTIPALRKFLSLCAEGPYEHSYNYGTLEEELSPTVTWLLMDVLCSSGIVEYGTSPRCGWLTPEGERLRDYMLSKTEKELIDFVCNTLQDDIRCYPTHCNCGDGGYSKKKLCFNPFWKSKDKK